MAQRGYATCACRNGVSNVAFTIVDTDILTDILIDVGRGDVTAIACLQRLEQ